MKHPWPLLNLPNSPMKSPTAPQIRELRAKHHLTQTQAAALVYRPLRTWQDWEAGRSAMDPAYWELFTIKVTR